MEPMSSSRRPIGNVTPLSTISRPAIEAASTRQTVSLRAIFSGLMISFLVYGILLSLGVAVGGSSLQSIFQQGQNARGLGIGSGIWMIVSTFISLFVGAYFAGRVSGFVPVRFGGVTGLVITALFFGILLTGIGSMIGMIGQIGAMAAPSTGATAGATGGLTITPQLQASLARGLSVAGWTLFFSMVIGAAGAAWGGASGIRRNLQQPLSDQDIDLRQRSAIA